MNYSYGLYVSRARFAYTNLAEKQVRSTPAVRGSGRAKSRTIQADADRDLLFSGPGP